MFPIIDTTAFDGVNAMNVFFFQVLPYIAFGALIIGLVARFCLHPEAVYAPSTQWLDDSPTFRWGTNLFHIGIICVFFGHIFGLFTPEWAYEWLMTPHFKRFLAIVFGTAFGVMAFAGMLMLTWRRYTVEAVCHNSTWQDRLMPLWLLAEIGLGLACVGVVIASPLETYVSFDQWAWGLLTLQPQAWQYIAGCNLVFYLHIVNGFLMFIIFPYSKMAHFLRAPLSYLIPE